MSTQSDVPLKLLTRLCADDLLPLFGATGDTVLGVETLELPASQVRLDNVLHLRSPGGEEYLHLIEWQNYADPDLLWRVLGYIVGVARQRPERPILATIVYLSPVADAGEALVQRLADGRGWEVRLQVVRLWEMDAAEMVASGPPGLSALVPLLRGADAPLIERAAQRIVNEIDPVDRPDLLGALGLLAERLIGKERFLRMIRREELLGSELVRYLFAEELQEAEARFRAEATARAEAEARQHEVEAQAQTQMQQVVIETLANRFPDVPARLITRLLRIRDFARLGALHHAILEATDLAPIEAAIMAEMA